jgi:hypothetical protein
MGLGLEIWQKSVLLIVNLWKIWENIIQASFWGGGYGAAVLRNGLQDIGYCELSGSKTGNLGNQNDAKWNSGYLHAEYRQKKQVEVEVTSPSAKKNHM